MRILLVMAMAVLLGGCSTRIGDLTVASPKNLSSEFEIVQKGVSGKDCAYSLLSIIPLGTLNPTIDGAIDDALSRVLDADALTDASIFNDILIAFIFNSNCIRVEGTAIRTDSGG